MFTSFISSLGHLSAVLNRAFSTYHRGYAFKCPHSGPQRSDSNLSELPEHINVLLSSSLVVAFIFLVCEGHATDVEYVELKPLLEAGLSLSVIHTPHYPGADQGRTRYLPLPYAFFRGRVMRADEDGALRGRFVDEPGVEFDLSLSAAFPADATDNDAREGMSDLDFITQVGPRLLFHFVRSKTYGEWDLSLPLRWVFSTDLTRLDDRGWVFNPSVNWEYKIIPDDELILFMRTGAIFATSQLMRYFYQVDAEYETSDRLRYTAKEGYLGSEFGLGLYSRLNKKWWVFAASSWDFFDGARNEDSPLMKAKTNWTGIAGVGWQFYESAAREESSY